MDAELIVLGGAWGVESLDPECLTVLAYCRFAGIKPHHGVQVVQCGDRRALAMNTSDLRLPALVSKPLATIQGGGAGAARTECLNEVTASNIIAVLRRAGHNIDYGLDAAATADTIAAVAMVETALHPLIQYWSVLASPLIRNNAERKHTHSLWRAACQSLHDFLPCVPNLSFRKACGGEVVVTALERSFALCCRSPSITFPLNG